jgi:molybdopterin-containing oxidoreductase family iron-sulfur binding subunit
VHDVPSLSGEKVGKAYWRSLDELVDTPEVRRLVAQEFPGLEQDLVDPATRRDFLKILGASLGLAGMVSCRWPKELIVPVARPEGRTPGVPQRFATAVELAGAATGVLVTSYDGRPVKIEGNPLHPASGGAATAQMQAAVIELYDPDRSRTPVRRESGQEFVRSVDEFAAFAGEHFAALRAAAGRGLAVLTEASCSPTLIRLAGRVRRELPASRWVEYEPVSFDAERAGIRQAFGAALRPVLHLDGARVVVCLDADPLSAHPDALRHARGFAAGRRGEDGEMSRWYAAEGALTLTGASADHRLALRTSQVGEFALLLARELTARGVVLPEALRVAASNATGDGLPAATAQFAASAAADLAEAGSRGLVTAGPRQPVEVNAAAHLINAALGAVDTTVSFIPDPQPQRSSHAVALRGLAAAIAAGEVTTLVLLGGNPVVNAPADLGFAALLARVPISIHLGLWRDETGRACIWHLPRAHALESWGDGRAWDGTVSVVQPLIEPLYGGMTPIELVATLLGDAATGPHELVRETLRELLPGDFEAAWARTLHDGVLAGSAPAPAAVQAVAGSLAMPRGLTGVEVVFAPDASVWDGRYANNAWLQELPDPLTKISWDNAALLGPATAARLGVRHGDVAAVAVGGRSLDIAVYVLPGLADDTVVLPLGYGRTAAGKVGTGVGFDSYRLRTIGGMGFAGGATVTRTGRHYLLATTQDHHAIDEVGLREQGHRIGELVREATLAEYRHDPEVIRRDSHEPKPLPLFAELDGRGEHQWGMVIDLSACIGCNACSIACQAENNIAVVGKKQVAKGREMHWIRVDRYFSGKPETPKVAFQPVTCQHCENAPCEQVCPVAATVHSDEGLNQMVYNRCVGTRYCSNNCPYKVRRFNFFNYFKTPTNLDKMLHNPEVTVRARGVMEKCTFCVQRIEAAKIAARNDRRPVRDGEVVPACAQTCPTEAITFGDLRDPASRVSALFGHRRSYALLGELNVQPRNRFLAKLRNPSDGTGEGS